MFIRGRDFIETIVGVECAMRRFIFWVLGILGVLVVGVIAAFFIIDWEEQGEDILGAALGREVRIGTLDIRPGWTTRVHVTDFQIANPDWARADHLVTLEEGEVAVKIWPLITGDMVFPEVRLREPDIALEKNAKGQTTWTFAADAESAGNAAPEDRGELPAIDELVIQDGSLSYRDAQRDLDVKGTIDTVKAAAAGDDAVNLSLDGTLQGRPVALDFTGGSMVRLRETEKPYPVDVEFKSGATTIRAEGTVTDPVQLSGLDIDLAIEGPTLGDIFPVIQVPLPDTPPYRLEGALGKEGERWRFDNFSGIVGDSDLSGSLYLDNGQKPPFVKADLLSNRLDFDDLAGLVGAEPEEEKADTDGGLFPDEPIAADRLHAMNMDVSFNGTEVLAPNLPIEELKFRVQVTDGRALFRPLSLGVADGTVSGEAALNARQAVPSADADLTFENLDLKPFFEGTDFLREMGGRFSGHAYVLGVGRTVAEMADTARGEGAIAMRDGSISGLLVEAAGLDVAEALGLVVGGGDARIGIRCGRVNLDVDKGKVKIEQAVVETTDSVLVADGVVDLGEQTLDVQVEARAKDFSLIDIAAPVRAYGAFADPSVAIGGFDPLPFFEMGDQESMDCDALVSGAVEQQFDKEGKK